jgi:tetratricopeptide (TPR) repeat protein
MVTPDGDFGGKVRRVFMAVADMPEAELHEAITQACNGDARVEAEVRSLLRADREAMGFLANPTLIAGGSNGATQALAAAPLVNGRIGRYRLLELIGEGGFGSVYLAEQDTPVLRKVAVKLIKLGMDTRQVVARFEHERQALAMMDHPNIARVLDAGATESGSPYFVMDLVKGEPIVAYCDKNKLSIDERLELVGQVCGAVQHAHSKGIIHRDIKPSNILVSTPDDGPACIKVIDFGIAKAIDSRQASDTRFTEHRALIGTPEYMSPEQAEGSLDIDTRSDVYALGVLLYELLTGSTPFRGSELRASTYAEVCRIIRETEPPKPSTRISQSDADRADVAARRCAEPHRLGSMLRGELDWIVMQAIEKDRDRRYETADGLAADLRRFREGKPVSAAPRSRVYAFKKFVGRNRGAVGAAAAVCAAVLVGLGAFAWQAKVAGVQRDRAIAAEAQAARRVEELRRVSEFQAAMLEQIEPARAGQMLTENVIAMYDKELIGAGVPEGERSALKSEFAEQWHRVNATDAAKSLIDRTILRPATEALGTKFADQPVVGAALRQVLADRYTALGMYDAATPLQDAALAAREELLGADHADTLASLDKQVRLLILRGQLAEAEPMCRTSLERARRALGDEHPQTIKAINTLGVVLLRQQRADEADPLMQEVLASSMKQGRGDDPDTLAAMNNLGVALKAQGKMREAEDWYVKAMQGRQRVLGPDHPLTLQTVRNVGGLLFAQGRMAEAEPLYRSAMEGYRRSLGDEHPDTLNAINSMGSLLEQLGQLEQADRLYDEALRGSRRGLGEEHPFTLSVMNNYASCLARQGRHADAEGYLRRILDVRQRVLGAASADTLLSVSNLGETLLAQSKYDEVVALLEPAVPFSERLPATQFAELRATQSTCLGAALARLRRFEPAQACLLKAVESWGRSQDARPDGLRATLEAMAELYEAWERVEPGAGYAEKGLECARRLDELSRGAASSSPGK